MCKKTVLVLVLLSSAAWLQAQAGYGQSDASQIGQTAGNGSQASIVGCLQSSNSSYTLTAASGSVYQLTGDTTKLSEHVGHEVRITGTTPVAGAANSPNATTPGASQAAILEVKSVKPSRRRVSLRLSSRSAHPQVVFIRAGECSGVVRVSFVFALEPKSPCLKFEAARQKATITLLTM